jgi:hypothetical protein
VAQGTKAGWTAHPWAVVVLVLSGLTGVALLVLGAQLAPASYPASVLVELGGGAILFVALFLAERFVVRRLEGQIAEAREEVAEQVGAVTDRVEQVEAATERTNLRLDDLSQLSKDIMTKRSEEIDSLFEAFANKLSQENTAALLRAAEEINATDHSGVRVRIPGTATWARFKSSLDEFFNTVVWVTIENIGGTYITEIHWSSNMDVGRLIRDLVTKLQQVGDYNLVFDADPIFRHLRRTLEIAIGARTGTFQRNARTMDPVIEIPNEQWAITAYGLECVTHGYYLTSDQLDDAGLFPHMREKRWVDIDAFEEALEIGRALFRVKRSEDYGPDEAPF